MLLLEGCVVLAWEVADDAFLHSAAKCASFPRTKQMPFLPSSHIPSRVQALFCLPPFALYSFCSFCWLCFCSPLNGVDIHGHSFIHDNRHQQNISLKNFAQTATVFPHLARSTVLDLKLWCCLHGALLPAGAGGGGGLVPLNIYIYI